MWGHLAFRFSRAVVGYKEQQKKLGARKTKRMALFSSRYFNEFSPLPQEG